MEEDLMQMRPIGYLRSVFQFKNGTPRQPSVCAAARGSLTVDKGVFNNPEHALEGLEQFSHAWILFVFHKNQPGHSKAKVKPPRLNGKRVGVFSTRSPYRPNAIGLTLAKIERISGIDIVDGTPVLDIKPFIPQYDVPECCGETPVVDDWDHKKEIRRPSAGTDEIDSVTAAVETVSSQAVCAAHPESSRANMTQSGKVVQDSGTVEPEERHSGAADRDGSDDARGDSCTGETTNSCQSASPSSIVSPEPYVQTTGPALVECGVGGQHAVSSLAPVISHESEQILQKTETSSDILEERFSPTEDRQVTQPPACISVYSQDRNSSVPRATVAEWLRTPPVTRLDVSFTPAAEAQLQKFGAQSSPGTDPSYRLEFLSGAEDVRTAVISMLAEDPRSVYRREKCVDSLYFFTVDQVHVTCWFDDKKNRAEVVRLQPVSCVEKLLVKEL